MGLVTAIGVTRRGALAESIGLLGHLRWIWLPIALGLEWSSMAALGRMQRRLLRAGGATISPSSMMATVYSANALSVSVPLAGPSLGAAFTFRRFERYGVHPPLAGWALVMGGVLSATAGVFVIMIGALLSGNHLFAILGTVGGLFGVAVLWVLHTATRKPRLRVALAFSVARVLRRVRRLVRRPGDDPAEAVLAWVDHLASLRPSRSVWIRGSGLALANWLSDAGVLAVSIYAIGAPVPWRAVLLVYGSGAVVGSLGITPGGIGLVEGTLCIGLVGAGLRVSQALDSVLLYRFISLWVVAAAGWVVMLCIRPNRNVTKASLSMT